MTVRSFLFSVFVPALVVTTLFHGFGWFGEAWRLVVCLFVCCG